MSISQRLFKGIIDNIYYLLTNKIKVILVKNN